MDISEISIEEKEQQLLQSHHNEPKNLFFINELIYFYSLTKPDKIKVDNYEKLFRAVMNDSEKINHGRNDGN